MTTTAPTRPDMTLRHETPQGYGDPGYFWEDSAGNRHACTRAELRQAREYFTPRDPSISGN